MTQPIQVNGIKLACIDLGGTTAPAVVLLHGFPFTHQMWQPQFNLLSKNFRVIAYDQRGHGASEVGDGQYMLEFFVDDLIGVLDHFKIDRAIVCGLSMGGYVALRAIERNPERIRALILCDTQAAADSNEAKLKRANSIKTVKKEGVKTFAEGFAKAVFSPESFQTRREAVMLITNLIQANSSLGICGALLALASRTDTATILPKINVPTCILVGEKDGITPPAVAHAMQEKIPNSELHVIPHAGHLSNLENVEVFNRHLMDFLDKIISRG